MTFRRFRQVLKYAIKHSFTEQKKNNQNFIFRLIISIDMIKCSLVYRMWTNDYIKEDMHHKNRNERKRIGIAYKKKGIKRDNWYNDFVENKKFLNKYTKRKYQTERRIKKLHKAYRKRYNMGKNCIIEYNVELSRQHYLPGTIEIGNNVILAKNSFIDYSGNVKICDGVIITAGVIIQSHHPDLDAHCKGLVVNHSSDLIIRENAFIGVNATILDSCNYIGKNARVGAGAVVTKDIPDNVTVIGVPAKIIKNNTNTLHQDNDNHQVL